eukprot:TRINITY_DN25197_c0_g1_i1.p1 TRINITY_DN25197_c0_g1~~TRINITY_DN25197_c0_g1_i1.p1  ORF type:complete len:137 (+),score=44.81 TRINITY_DN25197_c0_g1_i1:61-471(+)
MLSADEPATATFMRQVQDVNLERRQLDARLAEVRSGNEVLQTRHAELLAVKARQEGDLALLGELLATHTAAQAAQAQHVPAARAHQERFAAQEAVLHDSLGRKVAEETARAADVQAEAAGLAAWQPLPVPEGRTTA